MKYREVATKQKALNCLELNRREKGSHRIWYNPSNGQVVPVPNWGSKDLKIGTLRAVIRQLGLECNVFLGRKD